MASRTEDWGLPDRGRDSGVHIFLLGESADSRGVGVCGLAAWSLGQIWEHAWRLPWAGVACFFPPAVDAIF